VSSSNPHAGRPNAEGPSRDGAGAKKTVLITAGPTHEPIDAVRYLGNRSSGRVGIALAQAAAERGHEVTLLLGPTDRTCPDSRVRVERFRTTSDLQRLLEARAGLSDVVIMAAAVADYRPVADPALLAEAHGKLKRGEAMTLRLEPTPDLLAGIGLNRRRLGGVGGEGGVGSQGGQVIVGFALEPTERLLTSARAKLVRKGVDYIVANRLETMDAEGIEAVLVGRDGSEVSTGGTMDKAAFGMWLMDRLGL
jgi:phosphopantothenoylcysteine decarboxylase/phosphopantothenate--cysteine ligase